MNRQMLPCLRTSFGPYMQRLHTFAFLSCTSVHMLWTFGQGSLTGRDPTQPHRKRQEEERQEEEEEKRREEETQEEEEEEEEGDEETAATTSA